MNPRTLLLDYFHNRPDFVACTMPWGKPGPIKADNIEELVDAHLSGKPATIIYYSPKTDAWTAEKTPVRLGFYQLNSENSVKWGALDFDGAGHVDALADPQAACLHAIRRARDFGIPAYPEVSGSGHGYHLWVFFENPIPAFEAQHIMRLICPTDQMDISGKPAAIEVFPKQTALKDSPTSLTGKAFGNFIYAPFGFHAPKGKRANDFLRVELDIENQPYFGELPLTTFDFKCFDYERLGQAAMRHPLPIRNKEKSPRMKKPKFSTVTVDDESERIEAALAAIDPDIHYGGPGMSPGWLDIGMALHAHFHGNNEGLALFDRWSSKGQKYKANEIEGKWRSFSGSGVGIGTLFHVAEQFGYCQPPRQKLIERPDFPPPPGDEYAPSCEGPEKADYNGGGNKDKDRPQIQVNHVQMDGIIARIWAVLLTAMRSKFGPTLFRNGRRLLQLVDSGLPDKSRELQALGEAEVYHHLIGIADWVKFVADKDGGHYSDAAPPKDAVRDVATHPHEKLPSINGLITVPVFGPKGGLITERGYNPESGLFYDPPQHFKLQPIDSRPDEKAVSAALTMIYDDLLTDFPFCSDADRAHALAALITPFVRHMIDGPTPLFCFEAPTPGSGKGLLADTVAVLSTGRGAPARNIPNNEDEMRKTITSLLIGAPTLVLWDNANERRTITDAGLASVLTAEYWEDRLLGESHSIKLPVKTVWILTANNPKMSMEIARRCIRIRIDPGQDAPWLRDGFKHDNHLQWVTQNRAALIHALLTLVQYWLSQDRPKCKVKPLGSFERWSNLVGGVLQAAGEENFLQNLSELYQFADIESQEWRLFATEWFAEYADKPCRVKELCEFCDQNDLMVAIRGDGQTRSQQTRLGKALTNMRDRVFAGYKIVQGSSNGDRIVYHLEKVETEAAEPPGEEIDLSNIE